MTVLEFLKKTAYCRDPIRSRVFCISGLSLSIQGGASHHYCTPRQDCNEYKEVEIGFPSKRIKELLPYAENPDTPLKTVYGYVPIELIEKIVADNGGIDEEKTLRRS